MRSQINNFILQGKIRHVIKIEDDAIIRIDHYDTPDNWFLDCYCNYYENKSIYNAAFNNYKKNDEVIVDGAFKIVNGMSRLNVKHIKKYKKE